MNVEEEVMKAAEILSLPVEEVKEQFAEIARQNGLDLMNDNDKKLCLGLFRQWFGNKRRAQTRPQTTASSGGDSLVKTGFGVVIGIEDCRDMMAWSREQLLAQFSRNADEVFEAGRVAVVTENESGYSIAQILDGEETQRNKPADWEMPESAMDVDGRWIIPINDRKTWASGDKNRDYGKPLPKEQWVRRVHFIGQIPGGNVQRWTLSLKNDIAQNFNVELNKFIHIAGIWNEERAAMYGVRNQTLPSIVYNDDLDPNSENYRDVSHIDLMNLMAENFGDYMTPLINLERFHQDNAHNSMVDRLVITDGSVTNMNMRPSKTGSRTLFITDLNAEFNYEDSDYSSTPCWVPPHLEIDFGIGSQVVILGRSSQREVDGELSSVSINVFGIYVVDRRGNPAEVDDSDTDDDNDDWF